MKYTPHAYQRQATQWIIDHPRCALFLDMGLGKTVATLTALLQLIDDGDLTSTLVVAPKTVAETTWSAEAAKWDHLSALRVVFVGGTARRRTAALKTPGDVYVIGRDSFVWLVGYYNGQLPFDALVLDELTTFKSHSSQRFKALKACRERIPRIIGLTGTPAPNGLTDLWAEIYCLDGGVRLGRSYTRYLDTYFHVFRHNHIVIRCTPRKGAEAAIRAKLSDLCLSMSAEDYLKLPQLRVLDVPVQLPEEAARQYAEFERDRVLEFIAEHGDDPRPVAASGAAALIAKLSQMANGAVYDDEKAVHHIHNAKLDALRDIVEGAKGSGSGVLVFYRYRHDLERITAALKGFKVARYDSPAVLDAWNSGAFDVLLAHPASTAYGLNMQQGGRFIVWFGLGWNLEHYQQANARLYRQGQRGTVTVYRLLSTGTVDDRAAVALEGKKGTQQALLDALKGLVEKHTEGAIK